MIDTRAGVTRTVAAGGSVVEDQNRMRMWDDYGIARRRDENRGGIARIQPNNTSRRNDRPSLHTSWPGLSRPSTPCLRGQRRGWPAQGRP